MNPYNLELYTYLAPSKVCVGVGVFALIDIPRDTFIWKLRDDPHKVPWNLLVRLFAILHCHCYPICAYGWINVYYNQIC